MADVAEVVGNYIAMWNETDPEKRRAIVAATMAEDATYLDPLMSGEGVDGITAMIGGAQQQFPGHRFALSNGPDAHHNRVRFAWVLHAPGNGEAVAGGVDFCTLAGDGRLRSVTGFLEPGREAA